MKIIALIIVILIGIISLADSTDEEELKKKSPIFPLTPEIGIELSLCHEHDKAMIHVIPIPLATNRNEGWFTTTNKTIKLSDLSMLPDGTNRLDIQTICRGKTSEVTSILFDLQRPPPAPVISLVWNEGTNKPIYPPAVPGMVLPLPNGSINPPTKPLIHVPLRVQPL